MDRVGSWEGVGEGPLPRSWEPVSQAWFWLFSLSLLTRLHSALECPTWTTDLSWSDPLAEQVGKEEA